MRPFELRELSEEELRTKWHEHSEELFSLRFRKATGSLPDPSRVKKLKREIARIRTILRERELKIEVKRKGSNGREG